jgi:hypothetical protein
MDLAGKLQIKPGTVVCTVGAPADAPDLSGAGPRGPASEAGAVIAFRSHSATSGPPCAPVRLNTGPSAITGSIDMAKPAR